MPASAAWTWTDTMVDTTEESGNWSSLAFNGGNPSISYFRYDTTIAGSGLYYASYNGLAWATEAVVAAAAGVTNGQYTSLAFDNTGKPCISYVDFTGGQDLMYAKKNGAWATSVIDDGSGAGWQYSSLAFDNAGNPAAVTFDAGFQRINFSWYNGAAWIKPGAYPDGTLTNAGEYPSLAFNGGNPSISYYYGQTSDLRYVEYAAGAWGAPVGVDTLGELGMFTSLAFNGGNPSISYYDATNGNLKYASRTGGVWTPVNVDASVNDVGRFTSLAFDNAGNPGISYYDVTNGDLKYAWNDGTGWQTTTINATGDLGLYTSLKFNGADPCISYYDLTNTALWYVTGTWANPGGGGNAGGGGNSGDGWLSVGDACAGYASYAKKDHYVNITFLCDNSAISMISLLLNTNASEILATTTKKDHLPRSVPLVNGSGYQYIDIEMFKINLSSIEEGVIYFSLPLSWVTNLGLDPENFVMLHYNSVTCEWEVLDTEIIGNNGGMVYYRAYTDSFSLFAIGGDKSFHTINVLGREPAEDTPPPTIVSTPTNTPVPTSTEIPQKKSDEIPLIYLWIAILILVIVSVGFVALKRRKREEYPDWWFDEREE